MKIAYVTGFDDPNDPDPDLDIPFAITACKDLEIDLHLVNWQDNSVDWFSFDAALIRSTWDYVPLREKFVNWAKETQNKTRLFNPSEIVAWNTDKIYLKELEKRNVPIIPTKFCSNITEAEKQIQWAFSLSQNIALKPSIGAGARLAGKASTIDEALRLAYKILENRREIMVQPYIDSVDSEGEKAIVVIDGELSHVARKVPALTKGGHGDAAGKAEIDSEIEKIFEQVKNALPFWDELLYARIDVVRDDNRLVLMELELTEPWLFMQYKPDSAHKLFRALLQRIN